MSKTPNTQRGGIRVYARGQMSNSGCTRRAKHAANTTRVRRGIADKYSRNQLVQCILEPSRFIPPVTKTPLTAASGPLRARHYRFATDHYGSGAHNLNRVRDTFDVPDRAPVGVDEAALRQTDTSRC